jgi:hypothetical protein
MTEVSRKKAGLEKRDGSWGKETRAREERGWLEKREDGWPRGMELGR